MLGFLLSLSLALAAPPGWQAKAPKGAEPSRTAGGTTYEVSGQGVLVFLDPQPMSGHDLEDVAAVLVRGLEAQGAISNLTSEPIDRAAPDAGWLVLATVVAAGAPRHHTLVLRPDGDRFGVAMVVSETERPAARLVLLAMKAELGDGSDSKNAEADPPARARPTRRESASGVRTDDPVLGTFVYERSTVSSGIGGYVSMRIVPTVVTFTQAGWVGRGGPDEAAACARPDRPASCRRFERRGRTIRIENGEDSWPEDGFKPWSATERGLRIGERRYDRVAPLSGLAIDGTYVATTTMSAGGGPGAAGSATGTGSTSLALSRDGRFVRREGSAVSATAPGGVAASRRSGSDEGRYVVDGNWLTLTPEGGAPERLYIHARSDGWRSGDPAPAYLHIGGAMFERQ